MKLIKLSEVFLIKNGIASDKVEFVDTNHNNKIEYKRPSYKYNSTFSGFINKENIAEDKIFQENTLFVSTNGEGSHTYAYVSTNEFVPNSDISVLIPKMELTHREKLFYAMIITKNRYKFSYGRKPKGYRLNSLLIPHPESIPDYVKDIEVFNIEGMNKSFLDQQLVSYFYEESFENNSEDIIKKDNNLCLYLFSEPEIADSNSTKELILNKFNGFKNNDTLYVYKGTPSQINEEIILKTNDLVNIKNNKHILEDRDWKDFTYEEVFKIKRGTEGKRTEKEGNIPFISATEKNNGILAFIDSEKTESGNKITVSNDGSIGETFFQENEFLASSAITILINPQLNKYSSMFINTLIRKEKYRYSYGRKWGLEKMKKSVIKLPIDDQGEPDWKFMEDYIKTLPFSASI